MACQVIEARCACGCLARHPLWHLLQTFQEQSQPVIPSSPCLHHDSCSWVYLASCSLWAGLLAACESFGCNYHDRRESGSERFFFCFFSYIAKSLLPEGKQRREQKHELSNRICRHRRPFGAMIDRPAFAMGSAAHRRTPSSGQRRDGERSDVRPCACCGRTRRAERRAAGAYERAAYSRSSGSCWCSSA